MPLGIASLGLSFQMSENQPIKSSNCLTVSIFTLYIVPLACKIFYLYKTIKLIFFLLPNKFHKGQDSFIQNPCFKGGNPRNNTHSHISKQGYLPQLKEKIVVPVSSNCCYLIISSIILDSKVHAS